MSFRIILIAALSLVTVSPDNVQATIIHRPYVVSRYFEVADDGNDDSVFAPSWRWWLQAHRAIRKNPRLARKLAANPIDVNSGLEFWTHRDKKLRKLGLIPKQIQDEPTYIYTLHIASYKKQSSLLSFLTHSWLRQRMERRQVYKTVPKGLRLFAGGEISTKRDPLYSKWVTIKGQNLIRLCYGVYESMADANRDRRILERHLGLRLEVLRDQTTTELVRRVWLESVIGKHRNLAK